MKVEKVKKKVENKSIDFNLTPIQKEILHLLTNEFLTPKQISLKRKTSLTATYKILKKLKDLGILNRHYQRLKISGDTIKPKKDRLHGQQIHINIIYLDHRYKEILKKCNQIDMDGNTVMLYRNTIEIYSNTSFYAEDENKALFISLRYWERIIRRLENDLKVILKKPRKQNIKLVQQHYGDTENEIAEGMNKSCEKIRIYAEEDGRLCFMIDNSFNSNEAETTHPETAKQDMTQWHKHINDWRINKPPTLSEIMMVVKEMAEINKETAAGLNTITQLIMPKEELKEKKDKELTNYFG